MGLWGGHLAGEGQVPRWALCGVDGGRREGGHFRVEEAGTRRGKGAGATGQSRVSVVGRWGAWKGGVGTATHLTYLQFRR